MPDLRQLSNSMLGLLKVIVRELGRAARCFLTGKGQEGTDHVRFALQALHDDLTTLVASRGAGAPLPPPKEVDRVLIVKLDRLGDMVNTTPVFDLLTERYPDARIDIVGHPAVLALLQDDPRLGERFGYKSPLYHGASLRPPGPTAWRLVRKLRRLKYPLVIYLRGSFPFLLLGSKSRLVAAKFLEGEPVIRRYLKPLGIEAGPGEPLPLPSLRVSSLARERVLAKYPEWTRGPSVAIHAVSAAAGKQWPLERFARVADEIATRAEARVLFLAAPSERDKLDQIQALCKLPHAFETSLPLPEVVAAISHADVFIGNDSGLAHIAAGVQTREVIIWGGANLAMARPVNRSGYCTVLYREIACRAGCPEIRCVGPEYLKCLLDIREEDVIAAALEHLRSACTPVVAC